MPRTREEISRAIRAQLRILDPDLSLEPLTPERKIVDTVADVIAASEVDTYIKDYQFSIDTKAGADLDQFVALFGFARQVGRRASGKITLSRSAPALNDILIPAGTEVIKPATAATPVVTFRTTTTAIIYRGTTSVEVPIEAARAGTIGNVPAGTITNLSGAVGSIEVSSVTNAAPTTGGTTTETDAELRFRFKNTVFRNIAGTPDQYLALSIASRYANKARVIGPISRFIEYVQVASNTPSAGQTGAISILPFSKYTYNFDYYLTDGNTTTTETFYTPRGVDYTFNSTVPPSFTVNDTTDLPTGKVVLFEHSYCSKNSRNDPATNVANYVDIYVSGEDLATGIQSASFPGSGNNFVSTTTSPYYTGSFVRHPSGVAPTVGNRYQELLWQPASSLPATITIGGSTYNLNTHYWFVKDTTINKGSRRARDGIEWLAATASAITTGTQFSFNYTFDRLPLTINQVIEAHKQVASDVLVHSATERYLRVHLVVMYTPGFASVSVDQGIATALTNYFEGQQFGTVIQISDIIDVVHDVPGVDNVRMTTSTDNATAYGIREIAADGVTTIGSPYTSDFALQDSDLPVLSNVVVTQRSQNTWG